MASPSLIHAFLSLLLARFQLFTATAFLSPCQIVSPYRYGDEAAVRIKNILPRLSSNSNTARRDSVEGLMSTAEFELFDQYDQVLISLSSHIPNLLVVPLTIESAVDLYDVNFQFFVGETSKSPVVSGINELVGMISALRGALAGGNIAAFSWFNQLKPNEIPNALVIHSTMAYNPCNSTESMVLSVAWNISAPLFNYQVSNSNVALRGRSLIVLSPRVREHRLLTLEVNDASIDTSAVGDWVKSIRLSLDTIKAMTPMIPGFNPTSLIRQSRGSPVKKGELPVSLFYHRGPMACFEDWIPIHRYNDYHPIPGSNSWASYRRKHITVSTFKNEILPALVAGDISDNLFDTDASLQGLDGAMLLQGGKKLRRLYAALALLHSTSAGRLYIENVSTPRETEKGGLEVLVQYVAQIRLPVLTAKMRGEDHFSLAFRGNNVSIQTITQKSLDFGDQSHLIDGIWLTRQVIASVEAGEPLIRLSTERLVASSSQTENLGSPLRSDRAAATSFRLMEALHEQFRGLFDTGGFSPEPPASKYASDRIKLLGYMDEVLLEGKTPYIQSLQLLINSVRGAIRSGILGCGVTSLRVELTALGRIRCTAVITILFSDVFPKLSGKANTMKIELITEYLPNKSSGMIDEHLLLACRVNGLLTPADIVARFLRDRPALDDDDWLSMAREYFVWAKSLGGQN